MEDALAIGRPMPPVILDEVERETLERWVRRPTRSVTDDDVERVITLTLETTPGDATHWSTRSMAQRCGLSHNTVGRIWRAFGLQPHRTEVCKLSSDPF